MSRPRGSGDGTGERREHEEPVADELAQDHFGLAEWMSEQPLQGAASPLLGKRAHRDRRNEDREKPRQQIEEGPERGDPRRVDRPEGEEEP